MRYLGIKDPGRRHPSVNSERWLNGACGSGLMMGALIRDNGCRLTATEVGKKLDQFVRPYDRPDEVKRLYLQNPELMAQVENPCLRNRSMDWLCCGEDRAEDRHGSPEIMNCLDAVRGALRRIMR